LIGGQLAIGGDGKQHRPGINDSGADAAVLGVEPIHRAGLGVEAEELAVAVAEEQAVAKDRGCEAGAELGVGVGPELLGGELRALFLDLYRPRPLVLAGDDDDRPINDAYAELGMSAPP